MTQQTKRVYLASPFFSEQQIDRVKALEEALENNPTIGEFFSPRLHQTQGDLEMYSPAWAKATMENDVSEVDKADIIVAIIDFDGQDTDSGTAWELGYGIATGKPTFLLRFDESVRANIMLTERNTAFFTDAKQVQEYDFNVAEHIPYVGEYI